MGSFLSLSISMMNWVMSLNVFHDRKISKHGGGATQASFVARGFSDGPPSLRGNTCGRNHPELASGRFDHTPSHAIERSATYKADWIIDDTFS